MSKQKGRERQEDRKRKDQSSPDTGQGSAGNFGSDGDLGKGRVSDEKSKQETQSSPVPVKRKHKTERNP